MSEDERAIRGVLTSWFEATSRGDLHGLLALMTEDVVFLTAGRPPFGRDEFASGFLSGRERFRIDATGEFEEVVVVGDVAYARGRLVVSVTPLGPGDVKRLTGYTMSVYRKQSQGRWVLARDANLLAPEPVGVA